jgi:FtsP/CotA-like multicopper oxidase with cupredoxin domain
MNSTTFVTDWADPTLKQILDNTTTFDSSNAVVQLPNANEWVYVVISTTLAVPHPIHLHGHDFYVIAQGTGTYSTDVTVNLDNPPRRDTAMLPASGYLVLAFETNNPGAWLMHCHIGMFHYISSKIIALTCDQAGTPPKALPCSLSSSMMRLPP